MLVFFVVSGFCIHYPYCAGAPFNATAFLVRRGLRISLPLLAACAIAALLGRGAEGALRVVLWSVYCELIYYGLYPFLRLAFRRFGLRRMVWAAFAVSVALVVAGWRIRYHWEFPVALAWLVALPAWLLGCRLAEQVVSGAEPAGPSKIWIWRLGTWAYAAAALTFFYHGPVKVGHPALLIPFYAVSYLWIFHEIRHFQSRPPAAVLEWCGRWSYSLYLIHNMAISMTPISAESPVLSWLGRLVLIIAGSLAFYLAVEWPSHQLARTVSRRLGRSKVTGAMAGPARLIGS